MVGASGVTRSLPGFFYLLWSPVWLDPLLAPPPSLHWVLCSFFLKLDVLSIFLLHVSPQTRFVKLLSNSMDWLCERKIYVLGFIYYAPEIHDTKRPLICKPHLPRTVPERLEAVVYGRRQVTQFSLPKQVCFTHLHWMCLNTWARGSQAGNTSGCTLAPDWMQVWQEVCLPLIGTNGEGNELWVFFWSPCKQWPLPRNSGMDMARIHPPGQYVSKLASDLALNCGSLSLHQWD